jgi:hypothetical protein
MPSQWYLTQMNIGETFRVLAAHEPQFAGHHLRQALAAQEASVSVLSEDATPREFGFGQELLARLLMTSLPYVAANDALAHVNRGIAAYEAAVRVTDKATTPWNWLSRNSGLGNAWANLGLIQQPVDLAAVRKGLAFYRIGREADAAAHVQPVGWASYSKDFADVLMKAAEHTDRAEAQTLADEAVGVLEGNIKLFPDESDTFWWFATRMELARGLRAAGEFAAPEQARAYLLRAADVLESFARERPSGIEPMLWQRAHVQRGEISIVLSKDADASARRMYLERAAASAEAAAAASDRAAEPGQWAWAQFNVAMTRSLLLGKDAPAEQRLRAIDDRIKATNDALGAVSRQTDAMAWSFFTCSLGATLNERAGHLRGKEKRETLKTAIAAMQRAIGGPDGLGKEWCKRALPKARKELQAAR